jgi:colanic acid biosynthesis glycosyl transferase WcaI
MELSKSKRMNPLHILIHTQYFPPEIGAPQTRLHELALHLVHHGMSVTVLTAMPNYPRGRVYDGYGGWSCNEKLDGINVIRSIIYPYQGIRLFHRLISYFSFVFSSLWVGFWKVKNADFVITESPPLFLGIAGFVLSRLLRARWIFNISDLWPQSAVELEVIDQKSIGNKLGKALEEFLYRKAWMVTCQSRGILENIKERFPDVITYHLPNGVDTVFFQPDNNPQSGKEFKVIYAGLFGLAQGLDQILMAAGKIPEAEHITFTLVGDGPERSKLLQRAEELRLKTVYFSAPVPKNKVPQLLQKADVIVVPLKIQLTGAVPSKLYEAMAVGKPVILIGGGEAAKIVNDAQCGLVVRPSDREELVSAIRYLKAHPAEGAQMGKNGRESVVCNHDRKQIANHFARSLLEQA